MDQAALLRRLGSSNPDAVWDALCAVPLRDPAAPRRTMDEPRSVPKAKDKNSR
jgi:hypothetical protein